MDKPSKSVKDIHALQAHDLRNSLKQNRVNLFRSTFIRDEDEPAIRKAEMEE